MIGNVRNFFGDTRFEKKIKDMVAGEIGYCVWWAYNRKTNMLDEEFTIDENPGGSVTLTVKCIEGGLYDLYLWQTQK